jgi:hypothetical protein
MIFDVGYGGGVKCFQQKLAPIIGLTGNSSEAVNEILAHILPVQCIPHYADQKNHL